jgi:hypothetical protein
MLDLVDLTMAKKKLLKSSQVGIIFPLVVFLAFSLIGCTVKLISSYDEQTDKSVSALQRKVETFLVGLENLHGLPECIYAHQKHFYQEVKVDVSAMKVRAAAIPQNEITTEQLDLLSNSFDNLEELHKIKSKKEIGKNCISKEELGPLKENFATSFTAILKLELAKKRGDVK